jgi:hypothetical protein
VSRLLFGPDNSEALRADDAPHEAMLATPGIAKGVVGRVTELAIARVAKA